MSNIYLITAPSGAGKTTIAQALAKQGEWVECISHTTREMRKGEVEGQTYYYITKEQFATMHKNDELAEAVTYGNNRYGVSKAEIERVMATGKDVFIIVEHYGYLQVKEQYPEAIGIFLYMTKEDCMANMLIRGDKINDALERISFYDEEMSNRGEYDYVVRNVRDRRFQTEIIIKSIISQHRAYQELLFRAESPNIVTTPYKIPNAGTISNDGVVWK
jgi:guanylate kinase